jgi:iron complex outermembrane receptor protein
MICRAALAGLLATTALTGWASAQDAAPAVATPATAAKKTPAKETAAPETQVGEIVVYARKTAGGGQMVAAQASQVVETISKQYIENQSPSTNPASLIANLPSVNVSASDAFGLSGGYNVQIHGLPAFDLGFVLDGVPVYNSGSAYSNETIDSHDLTTLSVAPGTSTLDAPTIGSAAGTIYMTMRDPSLTPGGAIDLAGGTQGFNSQYLRFDSGKIGSSDLRAFISFSHTYADHWRGGGYDEKYHVDFKVVNDWDDGSRIALEGSVNRQYYTYYYYPSAQQFANYSADFNQFNVHNDYQNLGDTSYYRLNQQTPSYAMVYSLPVHWVINDHLTFDDTPYAWSFLGAGTGGDVLNVGQAYQGTQLADVDLTRGGTIQPTNGQVLVDAGFHSTTFQVGNVAKLTGQFGPNTVVAGWWHEGYINYERDPVGVVDQTTGVPGNPWNSGNIYRLADGKPYLVNDSNESYTLDSFFAGDTIKLLNDKLTISAGAKYTMIDATIKNFLPGADPRDVTNFGLFLPQAQIRYRFDDHNSVYADAERDFNLPFLTSVVDYYSINSGAQTSAPAQATPETAIKEEVGYRYQDDLLLADVSFFNINLKNHTLTLNEIVNGLPEALVANAGNQSSYGVDTQMATRPVYGVAPYLSFEYLDSTTGTNIADVNSAGAQDYLPTKGKISAQAPRFQVALGLTYTNGPFTAAVRLRWVDRQYADLMNEQAMPSYFNNDFTFAYKLPSWSYLHDTRLKLNISNIGNALYRTGIYFAPLNAENTIGLKGGVIGGSTPSYYVSPSFAAVVSLSTEF